MGHDNNVYSSLLKSEFKIRDAFLVLAVFLVGGVSFLKIGPIVNTYLDSRNALAQVISANTKTAVVLPQEVLPQAPSGKVWQIAFYDEFDGSTIDSNKWNISGDYLKVSSPNRYVSKSDSYLDGQGHLVSRVRYDSTQGVYTSGSVDTMGFYSPKFGYMNAKVNFHKGEGQNESFWLMSGSQRNIDNSSQDGEEIDVYEKPDVGDIVSQGVSWDGYGSNMKKESTFTTIPGISLGYHDMGLDWQPKFLRFYVDGVKTFESSGGGVTQQPGYLILNHGPSNWKGDITKAVIPDYMYVDYVHAYDANPKISYSYSIIQSTTSPNYLDNGGKLNDGIFATTLDHWVPEWVGVIGQPIGYFDIPMTLPVDISQVIVHGLTKMKPGIYLPTKIQALCGGSVRQEWNVTRPNVDGLYQILLNEVPTGCAQSGFVLRFVNTRWTFISEITVKKSGDNIPPTISITSPVNNSTTNPSSYVMISGTKTINTVGTDNVGVASVQFKYGNTLLGTVTKAPFSFNFDTTKFPDGVDTITATAYDSAGNSTSYFVTVTISNNNQSACSGVVAPSTVKAGSSFNVSVSFTNTGKATWVDNNQGIQNYFAATTPDGSNWFTTYNPANQFAHHWSQLQTAKVLPGEKATFSYSNILAPTTPGTYPLTFQMLQQNNPWFGAVCTQNIVVN